VARVLSGKIDQQKLEDMLPRLKRIAVYYAPDGMLYLYLIAESLRIVRAVKTVIREYLSLSRRIAIEAVEDRSRLQSFEEEVIPPDIEIRYQGGSHGSSVRV